MCFERKEQHSRRPLLSILPLTEFLAFTKEWSKKFARARWYIIQPTSVERKCANTRIRLLSNDFGVSISFTIRGRSISSVFWSRARDWFGRKSPSARSRACRARRPYADASRIKEFDDKNERNEPGYEQGTFEQICFGMCDYVQTNDKPLTVTICTYSHRCIRNYWKSGESTTCVFIMNLTNEYNWQILMQQLRESTYCSVQANPKAATASPASTSIHQRRKNMSPRIVRACHFQDQLDIVTLKWYSRAKRDRRRLLGL